MKTWLAAASVVLLASAGQAQSPSFRHPFESPEAPAVRNRVDEVVFAALRKEGLTPARLASDAVFVRRAHLDVIGTLPTAEEARSFLLDRDPDKRRVLIARLLERNRARDRRRALDLLHRFRSGWLLDELSRRHGFVAVVPASGLLTITG
mgnify:CR=1 FL=1